jgi:hypothetical protein
VGCLVLGVLILRPAATAATAATAASCESAVFDIVESIPTNVSLFTNTSTVDGLVLPNGRGVFLVFYFGSAAWLQLIGSAQTSIDAAVFYMTLLDGGDQGINGERVFDALVQRVCIASKWLGVLMTCGKKGGGQQARCGNSSRCIVAHRVFPRHRY